MLRRYLQVYTNKIFALTNRKQLSPEIRTKTMSRKPKWRMREKTWNPQELPLNPPPLPRPLLICFFLNMPSCRITLWFVPVPTRGLGTAPFDTSAVNIVYSYIYMYTCNSRPFKTRNLHPFMPLATCPWKPQWIIYLEGSTGYFHTTIIT